MKRHGFPLSAGFLALAILLAAATSAPQDKSPRIGIVNVKDCFDDKKCERVKDLQRELNEMKDKIQTELRDMDKQLTSLKSKIVDAPKEGPLFKKFRKEIAELQGQMKVKDELGKLELQEYWRKARGDVYDDVCKAAELVAKAKGLDLVLKDDAPGANETEEDKAQIPSDMKIVYRAVLFYDSKFDITKEVLAELNKSWQAEKAKNPNPK